MTQCVCSVEASSKFPEFSTFKIIKTESHLLNNPWWAWWVYVFSHFLSVAPSSSPSSSCRLIPFPFTCYICSTIVVCRDVIFLTFNYSLNTVSRWLKKAHLYPIVLFAVMITMHIFPPHTERVGPFNIFNIHLNSSWIRMKRKNFHEHILEWCFCSSSSSSHLVVDGKQIFFLFLSISLLPHSSHFSTASARRVCTEWTPKKKTERVCYDDFLFPMHVHEQFSAAAHLCSSIV